MKKRIVLLPLIFFGIFVMFNGCGDDSKKKQSLPSATLFNESFDTTDNWDFVNGATATVSGGVLSVTANTTEGIAMRLKDSVWTKIGSPTSYYVEMLIKPTSLLVGNNKNIGIASNISSDYSTFYYAGFNANGRMQIGTSKTPKGYQNSSDGTTIATSSDLVYYKWRYEYDGTANTISFYCNDLYVGKANATGTSGYLSGYPVYLYTPDITSSGTIGIDSSLASFDVSSVKVGTLTENRAKLVLQTTDSSLPRLWSKFLRWLDNTSSTGIKVGDSVDFTITALKADGSTAAAWTATTSNPSVLSVSAAAGASGDTLTVKGTGIGTATITVTNGSESTSKRTITYQVSKAEVYVDDAYTGITTSVYPNAGSTSAYTDGELAVTFDSAPTIADTTGKIYIYNYSTAALVDTIKLANDTEVISSRGTNAMSYGTQRARIKDSILYFAPHTGKLAYATKYYVVIAQDTITGTLGGKTFTGFSPNSKTWNFTTQASPTISGTTVTVDGSQSSTANFRTVQAALNYVNTNNLSGAEIQIQPGTYRELLTFSNTTVTGLTLKGMGSLIYGTDVLIQYSNGDKANSGTSYRPLAYFATSATATLTLVNLQLQNTADKATYGQAETMYFNGAGYLVAKNCQFSSHQDTLLTKGYNWFYKCYVEGDTDFIWGYANTSLFESCKIHLLTDGSYIFQARCPSGSVGYVLFNCDLVTESNGTSFFARSGGDSTVYDNVSIIGGTVSGSGTLTSWVDKVIDSTQPNPTPATGTATQGWKYYGITVSNTNSVAYKLSDAEYAASWSTRAKILGTWAPVEP